MSPTPEQIKLTQALKMFQGKPFKNKLPFKRSHAKIGRNDPCPCNSGKKYKNCCLIY